MRARLAGWRPDPPDHRDLLYRQRRPLLARMARWPVRPSRCYLRADQLPPVQDQGALGACVGHGVAELCDFVEAREGHPEILSRLAAYYWARGGVPEDTGAYIRDGIKGVVRNGIPLERLWPYDLSRWKDAPSPEAVAEGAHRAQGIEYLRLESISEILDCLASGFPVVFGTMLYEAFERVGADGMVPMPAHDEAPLGGHCMLMCGYSTRINVCGQRGGVYVRNSWGPSFGDHGNIWLSFAYIEANADDYWTVRAISP